MKKVVKIFSIAMVFVLMLSALMIPTSAATTPDVKFDLALEPVIGEVGMKDVTSESAHIYKLKVSLTSNVPLSAFMLDINFETGKCGPVFRNLKTGQMNFNGVGKVNKDIGYNAVGPFLSMVEYDATGTPLDEGDWGMGNNELQDLGAGNAVFNVTFPDENSVRLDYEAGDKTTMLGATGAKETFAEIYFKILGTGDPNGLTFTFGNGNIPGTVGGAKSVGYDANPLFGKFLNAVSGGSDTKNIKDLDSIKTPSYTVAPATSELTEVARYMKFTQNTVSAGAVDPDYMFRVKASITEDGWKQASGGVAEVGNVKRVGIVATEGTFNEADAKAAIKTNMATSVPGGYESGAYHVGVTNYVQHTEGNPYTFNCLFELNKTKNTKDINYTAFVEYQGPTDGEPQYIFFAAPKTLLNTPKAYQNNVNQWIGSYGK